MYFLKFYYDKLIHSTKFNSFIAKDYILLQLTIAITGARPVMGPNCMKL